MIDYIVSNICIWVPSIVAILGIAYSVLKARGVISQLKEEKAFSDLKLELKEVRQELKACKEELDIMIDEQKKIKDYRKNR